MQTASEMPHNQRSKAAGQTMQHECAVAPAYPNLFHRDTLQHDTQLPRVDEPALPDRLKTHALIPGDKSQIRLLSYLTRTRLQLSVSASKVRIISLV